MHAVRARRRIADIALVLLLLSASAILLCFRATPLPAARARGHATPVARLSPPSDFLLEWKAYNGVMFNQPEGITVGDVGDVFVTDAGNGRVCKFSPSGQSLASWDGADAAGGAFTMLRRIAADASGMVYTSEVRRIQRFTSNGDALDEWPGTADDGKPVKLQGIAVDADGNVYVTDRSYGRALKFNADGDFVAKFGLYGIDPDNFQDPVDIAVGPWGSVYVLDGTHVHKLSPSLKMEETWGSEGAGPGQFSGAEGIAVGKDGAVYVADSGNARVQVFTMYGDYLRMFGADADAEGCFLHPRDVAVSPTGNVYVLDSGRQAVLKFGPRGTGPVTDTTRPRSKVYGVDDKWHNTPVHMRFHAVDEGTGVRYLKIRLQDRRLPLWSDWVQLKEIDDSFDPSWFEFTLRPLDDHSVDGERVFEYCAVDWAGNEEQPKRVTVRIDTQAPRVTVVKVKPAKAKWGDRVTVTFRVQEQLSPKVKITGVVFKPEGVVVVHGAESGWLSRKGLFGWSFTCRLKPGQYKVAVQARDLAGNESEVTTKASAALRVE